MKKSLKRAVAVSAVCAAGLAGTLTTTPATAGDAAEAKAPARTLTNFGMNSIAYGTKVAVGGVDVKSLKDAKIITGCSRSTTDPITRFSTLSTDEIRALLVSSGVPADIAELVHLSASTSTTENYQVGNKTGVRAMNVLGDIKIGGSVIDDLELPTLKITGLKSVADSFHDPADVDGDGNPFGTDESFTFGGLTIDLPEDGPIGETLQTLFDIIGVDPNDVFEPVTATVNELLAALQEIAETAGLGDVIQIPGLGSIGLGSSFAKVTDTSAASGATALHIEVDPSEAANDSIALLKLGNAQSRIASGATSSVFRSTIMGLNFKALSISEDQDLLQLGGIGTEAIPCEGSNGETVTKTIEGDRTIPLNIPGLGGLATLKGIEYSYSADQLSRGRAKSVARSSLGSLEIPVLDLVISGVESKLKLRSTGKQGKAVRGAKDPQFTLLSVLHKGEELLPEGGLDINETVSFDIDELPGTQGFITFGPRATSNHFGGKLSAARLQVGDVFTLDLGWLESQIYPR